MSPQAETLRLILQIMDAERTLGSIESVALQYIGQYLKDEKRQLEFLPETIAHVKKLLGLGLEICNDPYALDTLELSEQERAGFKEAFYNRSP